MTCEWWTLLLAAGGGWVVINVALTSAVVLMAYLTGLSDESDWPI
jgi:hypothetical protein